MLATLTRVTGSLSLAEDAVQDAVVRALETWPRDGVPAEPRAWLTVAARRKAIDVLRREATRDTRETEATRMASLHVHGGWPGEPDEPDEDVVRDDQLRLLFTCCHPALALPVQVALALRTLCGLSTTEVAHALLVPEATMAKRLTRAKDKIAKAGIPYRVPEAHELPERLAGVLAAVHLVVNEGYAASHGPDPLRDDLAQAGLRLARLLHELLPDEAGPTGLLAQALLLAARRPARLDAHGRTVLLADQDRSRWDEVLAREGVTLLGEGLRRSQLHADRYVVQAALTACHALAPSLAETDWRAVVSWYDVLRTLDPSPVVLLNRAVAVAHRDGPEAGLEELDAVLTDDALRTYPLALAARGDLLAQAGRPAEAAQAYDAALRGTLPVDQRERLLARRAALR